LLFQFLVPPKVVTDPVGGAAGGVATKAEPAAHPMMDNNAVNKEDSYSLYRWKMIIYCIL
jgi:hypothetical protein